MKRKDKKWKDMKGNEKGNPKTYAEMNWNIREWREKTGNELKWYEEKGNGSEREMEMKWNEGNEWKWSEMIGKKTGNPLGEMKENERTWRSMIRNERNW